jgi:hypothetical protein
MGGASASGCDRGDIGEGLAHRRAVGEGAGRGGPVELVGSGAGLRRSFGVGDMATNRKRLGNDKEKPGPTWFPQRMATEKRKPGQGEEGFCDRGAATMPGLVADFWG